MSQLSRDEILAVDDRKIVPCPIPEWGKGRIVHVRSLTASERADAERKWANYRKNRSIPDDDYEFYDAFYATFTACDAAGKLLFTQNDAEWLTKKCCKAVGRIEAVARTLNGNKAADIEAIAKNSETPASCSSGFGSQPSGVVQ
jgi:hypothetical protein